MLWNHFVLYKNSSRFLIVVVRNILYAAVMNAYVCFLVLLLLLLCRGWWFWKAATQEPHSVVLSAGGEALLDWIIFSSVRGWKQQWGGRRSLSFLEVTKQSCANEKHTRVAMEISMLRPEPQFPVKVLSFFFSCVRLPTRVSHCVAILITVFEWFADCAITAFFSFLEFVCWFSKLTLNNDT